MAPAIARAPLRDVEVERVVHVHRRMIGREVERAEVVPLGLDFRPGDPGEAQPVEDLDDLLDHLGDRMLAADPAGPPRHGEIQARAGLRLGLGLERLAPPARMAASSSRLSRWPARPALRFFVGGRAPGGVFRMSVRTTLLPARGARCTASSSSRCAQLGMRRQLGPRSRRARERTE